jgi:hypothetical protein|tara:strand:+ start:27 stop:143 length:117 start_codon:yes stop_codon:yes gene_type:complete
MRLQDMSFSLLVSPVVNLRAMIFARDENQTDKELSLDE